MIPARRPLEDMIAELAGGVMSIDTGMPVRTTGIELALPVEAFFERGPGGSRIIADVPRLNTRTFFDPPLGRLTLVLGEVPAEASA